MESSHFRSACGIVDQLMAKRFYYMKSGLRTQQRFIRRGLERLRISAQYRVRILQSRKDTCRRFWLANFLITQFVISSILDPSAYGFGNARVISLL